MKPYAEIMEHLFHIPADMAMSALGAVAYQETDILCRVDIEVADSVTSQVEAAVREVVDA